MNLEGSIKIVLDCKNKEKLKVKCSSSRPVNAASVFQGKRIDDVLETLPMLFSVCSTAQARAAFLAWHDAADVKLPDIINNSQQILLLLEIFREHIWQILINWPKFTHTESQTNITTLATITQHISKFKNELFEQGKAFTPNIICKVNKSLLFKYINQLNHLLKEVVLQLNVNDWFEQLENEEIDNWINNYNTPATMMLRFIKHNNWQSLGDNDIQPLPLLDKYQWKSFFSEKQQWSLIETPTWNQKCYQTSVLTRTYNDNLLGQLPAINLQSIFSRYLSRIIELASIPKQLSLLVNKLDSGTFNFNYNQAKSGEGLAVVDAARGTLVHWLKMQDGVVTHYRILAPTEWNFHPDGVAVKGLETLSAKNEAILRQQAKLWLNAIDPCVNYQLEILNWS